MIKVNQTINEIFLPLWESKARYHILIGGRGAGRSTAGSQFLLSKLLSKDFFRAAIMREVHSDIRSTAWQEFMDRATEQGLSDVIGIGESMMTAEYGVNSIKAHGFRQSSSENTAKLKSLANYNAVLIEEAKEVGEKEFMVLDDTLRTVKGDIKVILLTNPPDKNHWIIKRWFDCVENEESPGFYNLKLKDGIDDAVFMGGTFRDNIINLDQHTIQRYQEYKIHKPEYYWQEIMGLVPEVVRGKIYHGWELIESVPKNASLLRIGGDWGWYPDPVATVALYYADGAYIVDGITYGNEIEDDVIAGDIKTVLGANRKVRAAFGVDEKKSIELMRKKGINAVESIAGPGSVNIRIKMTSEKKIKVVRKNHPVHGNWVWDAYEKYHWAEDRDGNPKGMPDHSGSDPMDAVSYAIADLVDPSAAGSGVKMFKPQWSGYGKSNGKGVKLSLPGRLKEAVWPKGF